VCKAFWVLIHPGFAGSVPPTPDAKHVTLVRADDGESGRGPAVMTWVEKYPDQRLCRPHPRAAGELPRPETGPHCGVGHGLADGVRRVQSVPGICVKPVIDMVLRLPGKWDVVSTTEPTDRGGLVDANGRRRSLGPADPPPADGMPQGTSPLSCGPKRTCACSPSGSAATPKSGSAAPGPQQGLLAEGVWDAIDISYLCPIEIG
jgi:hypothetical protein